MNPTCKQQGHWYLSLEVHKQVAPAINEVCRRCGIKYCPVAYDHFDPDLDHCGVCGTPSEFYD